jgi:hypothetical protein
MYRLARVEPTELTSVEVLKYQPALVKLAAACTCLVVRVQPQTEDSWRSKVEAEAVMAEELL